MPPAKILIILPAFNEAANLSNVITNIKKQVTNADIMVINDGSHDTTDQVATSAGAQVINLPYNVGIGAAVQTGFKFALQQRYDLVIRNDGDGQHAPEDIIRLITTLQEKDVDIVIGSRFIGEEGDYGTSKARLTGIRILSRLISFIIKQKVTDPTSGFCAFNQQAIRLFAEFYPYDYPEPEALVMMSRADLRMCEIAVTMHAREHGQSSITPIRSIYYMIKVTLAILIHVLRRPSERDAQFD